jgi:hypothetical protein
MMKPLFLILFFLTVFAASTSAQALPRDEDTSRYFTKVQIEAEFPGGPSAWKEYLDKHQR